VGPTVVGGLRSAGYEYAHGLFFIAGALVVQATLVASLRLPAAGKES
jgi:hypothetical protein